MAAATQTESLDSWAIVEIMGHQVYAGRISEQTFAGGAFVRIDVPAADGKPAFTKIFGAGSIFCITPCDEEVAVRAAASYGVRPFSHLTTIRAPQIGHTEDWDETEDD